MQRMPQDVLRKILLPIGTKASSDSSVRLPEFLPKSILTLYHVPDFYIIPLTRKLKECGVFGASSSEYLDRAQRNRAEWTIRGREVVSEMVARTKAKAATDVDNNASRLESKNEDIESVPLAIEFAKKLVGITGSGK